MDEITNEGLLHLPPAAIHEAIAYYHDHEDENNTEIAANSQEAIYTRLRKRLTLGQLAHLTGKLVNRQG